MPPQYAVWLSLELAIFSGWRQHLILRRKTPAERDAEPALRANAYNDSCWGVHDKAPLPGPAPSDQILVLPMALVSTNRIFLGHDGSLGMHVTFGAARPNSQPRPARPRRPGLASSSVP